MGDKRFTMCHEQNDVNGWTMSIVDCETKEPFNYTTYEVHSSSITDTKDEMEDLCLLLNELNDENEQLKKENYELHKRLGDFEPFEDHIKEITSKTSVNDIIGLVKTDEPIDSVELKRSYHND